MLVEYENSFLGHHLDSIGGHRVILLPNFYPSNLLASLAIHGTIRTPRILRDYSIILRAHRLFTACVT